MSPSWRLH